MSALSNSYSKVAGLFQGSQMRARSLRGTVMVVGAFGLSKVMQLGSNLILTRLLFPEAFGLMALVTVFVGGLKLISDVGIQPSIVRSERGETPEFLSTAWTLMVARGFWITGLAWLLAWPYAQLYDQDLLFSLICISALSTAVGGFKSIEINVRSRNVMLGRVLSLELVGQACSMALTVFFAWWTQSVWGLAMGNVAGAAVGTLLSHVLLPSPHNRFAWNRDVLSEIMVFGRWILLGTFFTYLGGEGLKAINGLLVSVDTLGLIHIASLLGWSLGQLTLNVIGKVGFPVMSRTFRERPQDLNRMAQKIRFLQTICTTPAFIAMSLFAQPLIDLLYDDRYAAAGTFLSVLALNGALNALPIIYQNVLLTLGHSRLHALVMGTSSALKIIGVVIGYYLGGAVGLVVAIGVANLLTFFLSYYFAHRNGLATIKLDAANLAVIGLAYTYILLSIDWTI